MVCIYELHPHHLCDVGLCDDEGIGTGKGRIMEGMRMVRKSWRVWRVGLVGLGKSWENHRHVDARVWYKGCLWVDAHAELGRASLVHVRNTGATYNVPLTLGPGRRKRAGNFHRRTQ
jgi:hypothetical protein